MLSEEDMQNLETIIQRSKGGFYTIQNESYTPEEPKKKEKAEVFITREAMTRKYLSMCEALGIENKGAGLAILNGIISSNEDALNLPYTTEDTVESAMMKIVIKEESKAHREAAEKKKKFDLNDDFDEVEVSKVNDSVDKVTTKKLDENIVKTVADATSQFISDRNERTDMIKQAYQDVIDKNKASDGSEVSQDQIQAAEEAYKYVLHKDKQRPVSLYEAIVLSVAKQYTNEDTKNYVTDASGKLDLDKVLDISSGIYGAMETLNQYNIVDINESVIDYVMDALNH